MDDRWQCSRRRLLASQSAVGLAVLAGCTDGTDEPDAGSDNGNDEGSADDESMDSTDNANSDASTSADDDESSSDLDLREANVVDVSFAEQDGTYDVAVSLHHDDDGEDGYANWWQVETIDGEQLGRRELTHPHSQQPFTRSETIEIPDGVRCVVVRGHDQTHGYGGRAIAVALDSGATRRIDQGWERRAITAEDCP